MQNSISIPLKCCTEIFLLWAIGVYLFVDKGLLRSKVKLIDDSGATTNPTVNEAGRQFNIVSGSISSGINTAADSQTGGGVGLFYPDQGILIFNAGQFRPGNGLDISLRAGGPSGGMGLVQIHIMITHSNSLRQLVHQVQQVVVSKHVM